MNTKLFLLLVLAFPMFASCDKAADAAGGATDMVDDLKNMDVGSMSPDAIKETGGKMLGELTSKLGSITDVAGATDAAKSMLPKLDILSKMKEKLGDVALPGMDGLKTAVAGLTEKFKDKAGIMTALGPLLEKLKSFMG